MHERWTRAVLRHQTLVVAGWLVVLAVGIVASARLPDLSSNTFSVPGTDSERARIMLEQSFDERPDGTFTAVFEVVRDFRQGNTAGDREAPRASSPGGTRRPGPSHPDLP